MRLGMVIFALPACLMKAPNKHNLAPIYKKKRCGAGGGLAWARLAEAPYRLRLGVLDYASSESSPAARFTISISKTFSSQGRSAEAPSGASSFPSWLLRAYIVDLLPLFIPSACIHTRRGNVSPNKSKAPPTRRGALETCGYYTDSSPSHHS